MIQQALTVICFVAIARYSMSIGDMEARSEDDNRWYVRIRPQLGLWLLFGAFLGSAFWYGKLVEDKESLVSLTKIPGQLLWILGGYRLLYLLPRFTYVFQDLNDYPYNPLTAPHDSAFQDILLEFHKIVFWELITFLSLIAGLWITFLI